MQKFETIFGSKDLKEQIFDKFPTYSGLQKYNLALKQKSKRIDMTLVQESLYQHLLKLDNVSFNLGQEINQV
jgi:hypothetical protein